MLRCYPVRISLMFVCIYTNIIKRRTRDSMNKKDKTISTKAILNKFIFISTMDWNKEINIIVVTSRQPEAVVYQPPGVRHTWMLRQWHSERLFFFQLYFCLQNTRRRFYAAYRACCHYNKPFTSQHSPTTDNSIWDCSMRVSRFHFISATAYAVKYKGWAGFLYVPLLASNNNVCKLPWEMVPLSGLRS